MAWLLLLIAGFFEIAWAIGLKYSEGFSRLAPSALTVASMLVSLYLLALAMRVIPLGTAYAVWTGIGAVGGVIAGIVLFGEDASLGRMVCLGLIVTGILGLKLLSPSV